MEFFAVDIHFTTKSGREFVIEEVEFENVHAVVNQTTENAAGVQDSIWTFSITYNFFEGSEE